MAEQSPTPITYSPIGIMHTPFKSLSGMPIQPSGRASAPGTAEIFPEYQAGLKDLAGFSHIILIYHLHRIQRWEPRVTPFLDSVERGLFSTRAPTRPNPIGVSIVRLEGIQEGVLYLANVDVLDQTPLLDIKPYVPAFDQPADPIEIGWLAQTDIRVEDQNSDDRFTG